MFTEKERSRIVFNVTTSRMNFFGLLLWVRVVKLAPIISAEIHKDRVIKGDLKESSMKVWS